MMRRNITGGNHRRSAMTTIDIYRRVPKDLTESTRIGAIMSILAMSIMVLLFIAETIAFSRTSIMTEIALDDNKDPQLQLNFNITIFDLHCDYVSVDVWDVLGTNRQNVTKNIEKWQLDHEGNRRTFFGRNRDTPEVLHEEHDETLDELHADGVHAVDLDPSNFEDFIKTNEMAFIDFYAPWCIWCQRLHPTWEKFAEEVEKEGIPLGVGKVDCVQHANLCRMSKIMAFPTLRWFENGKPIMPDYKMDRIVSSLKAYSRHKLDMSAKYKDWAKQIEKKNELDEKKIHEISSKPDNPACQVSGTLMINRVPGNFHIEAKSKNHNLNAAMTNLTHRVNHLSFGAMGQNPSNLIKSVLKQVPESLQQFTPIDDTTYVTYKFHQAHHHYIKVVSTHIRMGRRHIPVMYQFLEQSQIVFYDNINVPEARFSFDLSPMSVIVEKKGRKWYDYLTSLSAIIGGTFTTLGLLDATLYKMFKPKKL